MSEWRSMESAPMGDRTAAVALQLAADHLEKMGWKYTPEDIGSTAREIVEALNAPPQPPKET